ncbi:MAG: PD40 domain-containing protein, partial [Armatimonadetes bacterium]|nr:PD40 domain-containing protein [Armatimonadota bacterium]
RRHDEWIQGHQTWLGRRGEVVATVVRQPSGGGRWRTDVIFALTPEGGRRVIAAGHPFWHIGADSVGRWIVCDTCLGGHIYLVDADDGRCHFVCASEASLGAAQCSHPHPAISPDGRWIVFNSDRTGIAQLYAVYVGDITGSG